MIRLPRPPGAGPLVAALGVACFSALRLSAVTLVVANTSDVVNGDTSAPAALIANPGADGISLREAILAANAGAGGDSITFAPSLAGQTISLVSELPPITRDGTAVAGLAGGDGSPAVTIDTNGATCCPGCCTGGVLSVWASNVTIARLHLAGAAPEAAIAVRASAPGGAKDIDHVRIEDNLLDHGGNGGGIGIGAIFGFSNDEPTNVAVEATIQDVTVARNTLRGFTDDELNASMAGTRCVLEGLTVEDNTFEDETGVGAPALELDTNLSGNQIRGAMIRRNTFRGNWAAIHINGGIGQTSPGGVPIPGTGNTISGTVITQNRFFDNEQAIAFNAGAGVASGNSTLDTEISNNLMTGSAPYGAVFLSTGDQGSTANLIDGVRFVNDTIASNEGGIAFSDLASGEISDVTILNTIFWQNGPYDIGGQGAASVSPTVRFSLRNTDPRFGGADDFHLTAGSAAIGSGTLVGAPCVDLEGNARLTDGKVDMGAYEFGAASNPRPCPIKAIVPPPVAPVGGKP